MEEITFYRAYDFKQEKEVIQGYELKYEETIGGNKPYYKHTTKGGRRRSGDEVKAKTFTFEKGEYIISMKIYWVDG